MKGRDVCPACLQRRQVVFSERGFSLCGLAGLAVRPRPLYCLWCGSLQQTQVRLAFKFVRALLVQQAFWLCMCCRVC